MLGLVAATTLAVGYWTHRQLVRTVVPQELTQMGHHAKQVAEQIETYQTWALADVRAMAATPTMLQAAAAWNERFAKPFERTAEDNAVLGRLEDVFRSQLAAKPWMQHLRVIQADERGMEIVRVERDDPSSPIHVVEAAGLQAKGGRPFVRDALGLARGEVYISPLELNQDFGRIVVPYRPVIRLVTPLFDASGERRLGLVVLNIDLTKMLDQLSSSLHAGSRVYVVNAAGDYLRHATDDGLEHLVATKRAAHRWQDDFPALGRTLVKNRSSNAIITHADGESLGAAIYTSALEPGISVIEAAPYDELVLVAQSSVRSTLPVAMIAMVGTLVVAGLVSTSLIRPLRRMAAVVARYREAEWSALDMPRHGEFGVLASAFTTMRDEVGLKARELEQRVEERDRAAQRLQEQMERERTYLTVIESCEDAVITTTLDGVVLLWNAGAERLYGFKASEAIGRPFSTLTPGDGIDDEETPSRRVRRGERVRNHNCVRVNKEGRKLHVSVGAAPLFDSGGQITSIVEVSHDVTEIKQAEERFRLVLETCPSGVLVVSESGVIVLANRAIELLFGYTREELIGSNVDRLVPERFRPMHFGHRSAYASDAHSRPMGAGRDLFGRRKNGTEIALEIGLCPLDLHGRRVVLASVVDITERKEAEERFRLVVESSPTGLCMVDEKGTMLLVNRAIEKLFGYSRQELIGSSVDQLVPIRSRGAHAGHRGKYAEQPETRVMGSGRDLFGRRKDGTEVAVEIGLCPLTLKGQDIVLASVVDITERRRSQLQLATYAAQLERSNKELEKFAYVVSHDIKAPLRGIASVAEWIAADVGPIVNDDTRENLDLMLERTGRLSKLIDGILHYSRAGKAGAVRVPIDTGALVADVIRSIAVPENLTVCVEGALPTVAYDETQLRQVFQNLIDNALKHLGKPDGRVTVSCREVAGEAWEFSVADDGIGIAERHFTRIFELFQTLRPKDECRTAGAGLAIVKRIVESNGGAIRVASTEGLGATFTFSVPKQRSMVEQAGAAEPVTTQKSEAP